MLNQSVIFRALGALPFFLLGSFVLAHAANGVKIDELMIEASVPDAQRDATVKAARAFYDFWNTGDETLLKQAIAENFTDDSLPSGRLQGPEGPALASRQFRAAIPDLRVEVKKMIVASDYVTVHVAFTGHFTGRLGETLGKGQAVTFVATDLLKVENGRITDNVHIEDSQTLLQKIDVARVSS